MSRLIYFIAAVLLSPSTSFAIEYHRQTYDNFRVLFLAGDFTPDDEPRRLAAEIGEFAPNVISFNSTGGNIYAAMGLGRVIRLHHLPTLQMRNLECVSACALAFLGGVERVADPGSIGVHKSSFLTGTDFSSEEAVSAIQSATADVLAYLAEMGVDPGLLQLALRYESWDVRYLSGSEMEAHRVVTASASSAAQTAPSGAAPETSASRQQSPNSEAPRLLSPEDARRGTVRRSQGYALAMSEPTTTARELQTLKNGARVSIIGTTDRWYRVDFGKGQNGWMHHTWIKVDEFYGSGFEAKHVQIKSFDKANDVNDYLKASELELDVYLATNGWYAVTLRGTYSDEEAARLIEVMKADGRIPPDSFKTYGNTYTTKLCCG